MKLMLLLLAGLTSNAVFAHAGYEHHSSALLSGLLHPFSGLDHLLLALGLGLLLVRSAQFARGLPSAAGLGFVGLALSLLVGFGLGVQDLLPVSLTEYGIVASLLALAIALWVKQRVVALAGLSLLEPVGTISRCGARFRSACRSVCGAVFGRHVGQYVGIVCHRFVGR